MKPTRLPGSLGWRTVAAATFRAAAIGLLAWEPYIFAAYVDLGRGLARGIVEETDPPVSAVDCPTVIASASNGMNVSAPI